ncbi:hypothetical protein PIB30_081226 [Stylosanthes scabra]|uniref:Uncharacterized protein n=1 Tax=Stylosanthes scabra TaxID=79078 RepID=A0ABU6QR84_9FABA|nr:hypothetical protein [Stylosanthes scabra]
MGGLVNADPHFILSYLIRPEGFFEPDTIFGVGGKEIRRGSAESTEKGGMDCFTVAATFARKEPCSDLFRVVVECGMTNNAWNLPEDATEGLRERGLWTTMTIQEPPRHDAIIRRNSLPRRHLKRRLWVYLEMMASIHTKVDSREKKEAWRAIQEEIRKKVLRVQCLATPLSEMSH